MTQDEIIEMATQAGAVYSNDHAVSLLDDEIIIFAKLVAQRERKKAQDEIDTLYEMYKLVCSQRDELMDQQRAQIAALRGRIQ